MDSHNEVIKSVTDCNSSLLDAILALDIQMASGDGKVLVSTEDMDASIENWERAKSCKAQFYVSDEQFKLAERINGEVIALRKYLKGMRYTGWVLLFN